MNQDDKEKPINGLPPENTTKNPTRKLEAETTVNHTTVGSGHINPVENYIVKQDSFTQD